MRDMQVLMIGWEFPPSKSGGLGTHCYELVKNLGNKGVKVILLVPKRSKGAIKNLKNVEVIEIGAKISSPYNSANPNLVDPQTFEKEYGWNFFNEVRMFNRKCVSVALTKQFDAIHCHDWMTIPAGIELKAKTGKPLIFTVHSTEYDRTADIYPMDYIIGVEKEGIEKADFVITVSKSMKKQLIERYNADERKIQVIYNGIDYLKYNGLTIKDSTKTVLFLGRLTNQKGPYFFLHAAKKVLEEEKDVLFIVVGQGDRLPELIREAFGLGIMDKVLFTGFVSEEEVLEAYSRANIYVMPSVAEPFGITALEAIASGTPIIISKNAGVAETISHCFKVDFWDTHEMANEIISLLRYPPLSECMRRNSYKELKELSWERTADQTMDVYRRVL